MKGDGGDPGGQKGEQGTIGPKGMLFKTPTLFTIAIHIHVYLFCVTLGGKGDTGGIGPMGDHGPPGPQGERGTRGSIGRKGDVGDEGVKGCKGDGGMKGEKGSTGRKGPPGLDGLPGAGLVSIKRRTFDSQLHHNGLFCHSLGSNLSIIYGIEQLCVLINGRSTWICHGYTTSLC